MKYSYFIILILYIMRGQRSDDQTADPKYNNIIKELLNIK